VYFAFIFHRRPISSHCYAIIFRVCFVFCSCHLLWFHQLLNLLGITHSCFGVFLTENPAVLWLGLKHLLPPVEVSVELHCCWLALCCQRTPPRATQRAGGQVSAGCSAELQAALPNPELCLFPSFCSASLGELLRNNSCILGLPGLWFSRTRQDKERSLPSFLLRL